MIPISSYQQHNLGLEYITIQSLNKGSSRRLEESCKVWMMMMNAAILLCVGAVQKWRERDAGGGKVLVVQLWVPAKD